MLSVGLLDPPALDAAPEDLSRAFKVVALANGERKVEIWSKKFVRYNLVGDLAWQVKDRVGEFIDRAHAAAGLELSQNSTSDLMMIYDSKIFQQLRDQPELFAAAHIPRAAIETLSKQASLSHWTNLCQTIAWTDGAGGVVGAIVLSQSPLPKCVDAALYDVFGVADVSDPSQAMKDLCLLYRAVATGDRDLDAVVEQAKAFDADCRPFASP